MPNTKSRGLSTLPLLICLLVVVPSGPAPMLCASQDGSDATESIEDSPYVLAALQRADTSSPRATLRSFIELTNTLYDEINSSGYFDRESPLYRPLERAILDCLDDSEIPAFAREQMAGEVAICLKEILDRVEIPDWNEIPGKQKIADAEDPAEFDRWQIPGTRITIAKVTEGPRIYEYLFSAGTVERTTQYYEDVKLHPYRTTGPPISEGFYHWYFSAPGHLAIVAIVDLLPEWAKRRMVFGVVFWKWLGVFCAVFVATISLYLIFSVQRALVKRVGQRRFLGNALTFVIPLAAILIPLGFKDFVSHYIVLRGIPLYLLSFAANVVAILAGMLAAFALANRIAEILITAPHIHREGLDAQLIRIVCKIFGLAIAVVIFLLGGQYLGIPFTTLLASAGVGGFAVALAAQDTLKTVFGTLMLMGDKPFRSGDRIVFGKYDGIVEEIGLRSTRIRLLTGHQATIPNDELARCDIENIGRRPHIRRLADIKLPLETPRQKIKEAVEIIRTALKDHEGMDPDRPPRVFFNEFNEDSFNIRMMYWYTPPNYWDYMAFSERLNIEIFEKFDQANIKFLLPMKIRQMTADSLPGDLDLS